MPETVSKKLERMLQEAQERRTWGRIEIDLKDGRVILLRQTAQFKPEDCPGGECGNQR